MKTCCTVVIGHVDHGKTALVRALTGIETDRLPEEKARGLSITPGFAHKTYSAGIIDFVDAPGHADFISAMVSGATGAQAALVVISMVDGVCAQTLEHLNIAGLLGISTAVIAVTKSDLISPSEQAEHLPRIHAALSSTPFAGAPLVVCSASSGDGIGLLHTALEKMLERALSPHTPMHSFLPIDRTFTLAGRGTIVTGTLLGQNLTVGGPATLQPTGQDVKIRGLQSRGVARETVHGGERMAANLRGVAVDDIPRGAVLCAKGIGAPSACCDVHLDLFPAQVKSLKHMQDLRVMFGTSTEVAQVRLFSGAQGYAQLRFKKPVVCFAGQRAILRRLSPPETMGGAVFLDPLAQPAKSNDTRRINLLRAASGQDIIQISNALTAVGGGVAVLSDIARLSRQMVAQVKGALGEGFVCVSEVLVASTQDIETAKSGTLNALAAYHVKYPLRTWAPRATRAPQRTAQALLQHVEETLVTTGEIRRENHMLALRNHDPFAKLNKTQQNAMTKIESTFQQAGLNAVTPDNLAFGAAEQDLLQLLIETGRLVSLPNVALKQTLIFHRETLVSAATTLRAAFPELEMFTTSQARSALGTSRRVIVPLLEHFDSQPITVRHGDARQIAPANLVSPSDAPC